jgi:hypothetical protein
LFHNAEFGVMFSILLHNIESGAIS